MPRRTVRHSHAQQRDSASGRDRPSLNSLIAVFDTRIASILANREEDLGSLDTIPGIGRLAAEIIIAETGGGMAQFASAQHLASWIGVCPGQNESAGVSRSGRTRPSKQQPQTPTRDRGHGRDQGQVLLPEHALRRITRQANALGLTVRFDPIETA
jgi:hypothetical protein